MWGVLSPGIQSPLLSKPCGQVPQMEDILCLLSTAVLPGALWELASGSGPEPSTKKNKNVPDPRWHGHCPMSPAFQPLSGRCQLLCASLWGWRGRGPRWAGLSGLSLVGGSGKPVGPSPHFDCLWGDLLSSNQQQRVLLAVPPQLLVAEGSGQVAAIVGQPLELPCRASGSPAPTIQCVGSPERGLVGQSGSYGVR